MQRSAQHTARLLVCAATAAVPVTLVTACSPGSPSADAGSAAQAVATSSPASSASAARTRFAKLPAACSAITQKTVKAIVPKAKTAKGDAADSSDTDARGGCSWNGLNGYQYRWLAVSLQRFDAVQGIGSANAQATKRYQEQVGEAGAAVKGATSETTTGVGDQATTITAKVAKTAKDKETYEDISVVARTGNVVIVLDYNGAGFEDAKTPKAADLQKNAVAAAKEVVVAIAAANA